jgi:hypothetical protein
LYHQMSIRRPASGAALNLPGASTRTLKRARSIYAECAQNTKRKTAARNRTVRCLGRNEEPEDILMGLPGWR